LSSASELGLDRGKITWLFSFSVVPGAFRKPNELVFMFLSEFQVHGNS